MTRHESRIRAFCFLFEYSFGNDEQDIMANAVEYRDEQVSAFAKELFLGTLENLPIIDQRIGENAENRKFERIAKIPLACLRLASYELLYTDTPSEIIINEAIEICREFNCDDSVSYINGVLGKVAALRK